NSSLVERALSLLDAGPNKRLLDVGCGNGMITSRLAPYFRDVTAIDFSTPLIRAALETCACPNVEYLEQDALALENLRGPYDSIMMLVAFQYFTPSLADRLFKQLVRLLSQSGQILLGDVPDGDRIWNFYRGVRGRMRYAWGQLRQRPVIGHW